jgi:hypothetical protein
MTLFPCQCTRTGLVSSNKSSSIVITDPAGTVRTTWWPSTGNNANVELWSRYLTRFIVTASLKSNVNGKPDLGFKVASDKRRGITPSSSQCHSGISNFPAISPIWNHQQSAKESIGCRESGHWTGPVNGIRGVSQAGEAATRPRPLRCRRRQELRVLPVEATKNGGYRTGSMSYRPFQFVSVVQIEDSFMHRFCTPAVPGAAPRRLLLPQTSFQCVQIVRSDPMRVFPLGGRAPFAAKHGGAVTDGGFGSRLATTSRGVVSCRTRKFRLANQRSLRNMHGKYAWSRQRPHDRRRHWLPRER